MEIKVYEINEEVVEEQLKPIDKENINKIFLKLFSVDNTDHLKIDCHAKDNSIFQRYKKNQREFNMADFASKLGNAERKSDGTRNKQITSGNLFIKRDIEQLLLLKLENIEVIDKEKNYEMRTTFSTESNYYKGCIFRDNLDDITVIDKNKSIAKYWREGFLDLSLNRDEYQNTKVLIELLKNKTLFSKKLIELPNYNEINNLTENYIFDNSFFDKVGLANILREKSMIEEMVLNDIFSDQAKEIDTEFSLSSKAIKENYKKTILVSAETKIYTDNYIKLLKQQGIEFAEGKIILTIEDDYICELPEELKK